MRTQVLVVEDEESLRSLYKEELEEEGYEVLTACNGKEALSHFIHGKPDLVVLDIVMPVMDGMEALGQILQKDRRIPVVLHTSHPKYRQDFMSWAADAYMMKSSDLGELKQTIRGLLEKSRASKYSSAARSGEKETFRT